MQQKGVHWFPGHMQKAMRQIKEKVDLIDVVVEVVDARCPISSKNKYLEDLTNNKPRVIVFSKKDLASLQELKPFISYYENKGYYCVICNLNNTGDVNLIKKAIVEKGKVITEKYIKRGMKPQPIRAMIIGIPNAGKSTLINRLSKSASTSVANTPGHTRSQQWIKVDNALELLDTPGVLPPVYDNKISAIHLALTGAMKIENIPESLLAEYLATILIRDYPNSLKERFDLEGKDLMYPGSVYQGIARKRGLLIKQGEYDIDKAELLLLKEFKEGLIVKLVLDKYVEL